MRSPQVLDQKRFLNSVARSISLLRGVVARIHMPDNNLIVQDHRSIKLRLGPMLGLKRFQRASITIAGIELIHRIRKGQFKLGKLCIKDNRAPEIWNAVLAAWTT